jgi:hypothetical protein
MVTDYDVGDEGYANKLSPGGSPMRAGDPRALTTPFISHEQLQKEEKEKLYPE